MKARQILPLMAASLGFAGACGSDGATQPVAPTFPAIKLPNASGNLKVGDLVSVNVNGNEACSNARYSAARVVSIGTRALVLNDTLNPKGFSQADFDRFAARFDTLVYPLDVGAFGAPTDIDNNGHIALVFTRAVNELTPRSASSYVGGFTYSRDLFPISATARAQACASSNQGEYFYLLTPDPSGVVNGNARSVGFVDSVTTSVIAHEFEHLINASRRLYVNNTPAFEEKWLDEGLAHIAEELLFYRESGTAPRRNLGITEVRASPTIKASYNVDMTGNAGRYRSYLQAPEKSSPFAADDSLSTRGAAWSLLRYSSDRVNGTSSLPPGQSQSITGSGDVTLAPDVVAAEYSATLVNLSLAAGGSTAYSIVANGISAPPVASLTPVGASAYLRAGVGAERTAPQRDVEFEAALRGRERALISQVAGARSWFAAQRGATGMAATMSRSASSSSAGAADLDGSFFFSLVNSPTSGIANLQSVVGGSLATFLRDWSVSHIVDDVAQPSTQLQQPSWNWHSIYPALGAGGGTYPLQVNTLVNGTALSGTVVSGGAAFFRFAVPANGAATISLPAPASGANGNLQLVIVRIK